MIKCIGLIVIFGLPASIVAAQLKIVWNNVRSDRGRIEIAVYQGKDGFPDNSDKSIAKRKISVEEGTVIINDLPEGELAVSIFHDENEDEILNKNGLGIPKEGIGFSRNPGVLFGPPSYKKAKFKLGSSLEQVTIKLKYFSGSRGLLFL
jgi:uncharacterized protein (DUF2141 family)